MKKTKNESIAIMLFLVLLSYLTYQYVRAALPDQLSDYNGHTYVYYPLFSRDYLREAFKYAPYFLWHAVTFFFHRILLIPLEHAAAYSACVFAAFSYWIFYWIIQKFLSHHALEENHLQSAFLAFCLCILQPISIPWADTFAFSPNPLHNPTHMCARGFSLLCFCLICDIWGKQETPSYHGVFFHVENGLKKYYCLLSILLFLSTMAKPTFAEMFIPSVAIIMLVRWIRKIQKKDGTAGIYFKHCLYTLYCSLPTLLYILFQFFCYFLSNGEGQGEEGRFIITKFLEVWKLHSDNVALSLVLSLLFPIYMIMINPNYFWKSDLGLLATTCFLVSLPEAAFFGESGIKFSNGNFFWSMMSAMLLLFLTCTLRLLQLEQTQTELKIQKMLVSIGWLLFFLHSLFGILIFFSDSH